MASYSQSLDLTAETATMTLTVGADITTYTYDNTTKLITFGARTSPMNLISLAELLLYVDAFRLWMGTLFKAFRPLDTTLLSFVRTMVTTPTAVELDDTLGGNVTIDATFIKATNITVLGSRPAATMYWSDLKKWLVFVETFSLTCSEVM